MTIESTRIIYPASEHVKWHEEENLSTQQDSTIESIQWHIDDEESVNKNDEGKVKNLPTEEKAKKLAVGRFNTSSENDSSARVVPASRSVYCVLSFIQDHLDNHLNTVAFGLRNASLFSYRKSIDTILEKYPEASLQELGLKSIDEFGNGKKIEISYPIVRIKHERNPDTFFLIKLDHCDHNAPDKVIPTDVFLISINSRIAATFTWSIQESGFLPIRFIHLEGLIKLLKEGSAVLFSDLTSFWFKE